MAAFRALCLFIALAGFFLVGTPLQWLVQRVASRRADAIPVFFCRTLLRILKVRTTIEGKRATGRPTLVVANHVSWIDVLVLGAIQPFCFLAKSEVSRWPILSAFANVQGTVFVDRRRRRSIIPANGVMAARMLEGRTVLLFPEGTTVDTPEPGLFRSSHFAAARDLLGTGAGHREVTVQPVAIRYSSPAAAWVGEDALLPHLWRTLCAPPLECRVVFTRPICYGSGSDRKSVARASRAAIIDALERQPRVAAPQGRDVHGDLVQLQPTSC